jgi:16S rRNA (uracil1498-N3)-methyltransferase
MPQFDQRDTKDTAILRGQGARVMNLIILDDGDFVGDTNRVRLQGRRLQHVLRVHRAAAGDRLRVGRLNGRLGTALITTLGATALDMEVTLDQAPPAPLPLTLLLALPRPKSVNRVVQAVTAMGVKRVVLMNAWRVEKSFWESPVVRPETLREQMVLGLEQACDTLLPEILLRPRFKPFVEDEVPALVSNTRALVAHPHASRPCPRDVREPLTLAVGPEGGFIPYEVELLQAHGFEAVSLGARILRVEHVVPALLGRLF